jgi:signal transduction histidine kinase
MLLLGMRGDLDLCHHEDIRELQRLLTAASLALSNSAAYAQPREAETMIRQLYQHLQVALDTTAAAVARELHDQIMNVNVRLNIEPSRALIGQVRGEAIRAELELLLQSDYAAGQALRMICEQLHPAGVDDPLGLAAVLRMQIEKVQSTWAGTCRLAVERTPCPVPARTQREALRITREAFTNAVKHANATGIVVHLRYPDTPTEMIQLAIRDNGRNGQAIQSRSGHFGIRNMVESARAVGGTLQFHREGDRGTAVVFMFDAGADGECISPYSDELIGGMSGSL